MTPYFVVWIPSQTNDSQFIAIEPKAQTCIKQQTKDNLSRTMLEKSFILVFLGEVNFCFGSQYLQNKKASHQLQEVLYLQNTQKLLNTIYFIIFYSTLI